MSAQGRETESHKEVQDRGSLAEEPESPRSESGNHYMTLARQGE